MRKRASRSVSRGRRRRRSQSGAGSFSSVSSRLVLCLSMIKTSFLSACEIFVCFLYRTAQKQFLN